MSKNKSRLLLDEKPMMVIPSLAKILGLNEAIILQQTHYWLTGEKSHLRDGHLWIYNTLTTWQENFPWWSESTIKRALNSLRDRGLLIVANYNEEAFNKRLWYRIDYDVMNALDEDTDSSNDPIDQVKMTQREGQNDQAEESKLTMSSIYTETTYTETTTKRGKGKAKTQESAPALPPSFASATLQGQEEEEEDTGLEKTEEIAAMPNIFDELGQEQTPVITQVGGVRVRVAENQARLAESEPAPATLPKVEPAKKLDPTATSPLQIFVPSINQVVNFDRQEFIRVRDHLLKTAGEIRPANEKIIQAQKQLHSIAELGPIYCTEAGVLAEMQDYLDNYKKPTEAFVIEWFLKHCRQLAVGTIKRKAPKQEQSNGVAVRFNGKVEELKQIHFNPDDF